MNKMRLFSVTYNKSREYNGLGHLTLPIFSHMTMRINILLRQPLLVLWYSCYWCGRLMTGTHTCQYNILLANALEVGFM